jgi:peptide/nickel transport system substrate-binding protein
MALEIWQDESPVTMLYNPLEGYALAVTSTGSPTRLYYMDFRPYNLSFE